MHAVSLRQALDRAAGPLRGLSGLTPLLAGAAVATLVFAVTAWLSRTGWVSAPIWVLVAWALALVVLAASVARARRAIRRLGPWQVGRGLEHAGAWRHGALTMLLDPPASGTSDALHDAATDRCAAEVLARGPAALGPAIEHERHLSRRAAAVLAVALVGLIAARPATGVPARLWHPWRAWTAFTAPVRLRARAGVVASGERAVLELTALGHQHATLSTRAPGEAWHTTIVALDTAGNAVFTTPPLVADLVARLSAGGRESAEVHVGIRLAAFLGSFIVTARYPAYLGLEDEVLPITGDTLVLPEGTRLDLAGRATTALATAQLRGSAGDDTLAVDGLAFHGQLTPPHSASWQLRVTTVSGDALEGDVPALPVRIVPDSAPVVDIPVPGADTVAAVSMALALVIGIRDDHGITAAAVEARRNGGPAQRKALTLPPGTGDRALVATSLDLAALGLKPGDTLRYVALATDNAPAAHTGRSREYLVRIPTVTEQRAARQRETGAAATALDSLSRQAAAVQRTEEDLARERQRANTAPGASPRSDDGRPQPLTSEAARKADAAAQAQQKVMTDAAKLQQAVQSLRDAAHRDGGADSALSRELDDIKNLLDKALSPELRDKLASLQKAVQALDAEQTQAALQDLAKQQAQLKAALDQARELFKRAALETELADQAQDARQLALDQHELTPKLAQPDSSHAARAEEDLARRADSLAAGLDRAAEQVPAQQTRDGLQHAGQQARQAASKMRAAAQSRQQGKPTDAQADAKQAEDELNPLSKEIDDNRQSMQAEMRAQVKQALERALEETSRLAERQLAMAGAFEQGAFLTQARADQGLIEEGAAKLMQQVAAISAMNALVSPQAGAALAASRQAMRDAVEAVSSVNPNSRLAFEKSDDAVDGLAVAAFALMQSKDRVNGSQSGSGVQEAMEQMQQMAGKQGQLAQQGGTMMQGAMNAQQLMQMALQQRALQQQLERMRAGGQLPGAGELARQARELTRDLENGRLNQDVIERQHQLSQHMLDAGRSLQGQEDDENKQRQSVTAKDAPPAIPPALDPRIRNGTDEIRLPTWEALQRLSPDERRRVMDYFRLLTQTRKP